MFVCQVKTDPLLARSPNPRSCLHCRDHDAVLSYESDFYNPHTLAEGLQSVRVCRIYALQNGSIYGPHRQSRFGAQQPAPAKLWGLTGAGVFEPTSRRQDSPQARSDPRNLPRQTGVLRLPLLSQTEIEHIEQVSDSRHVRWHVRIVIVNLRITQIVSAAVAERSIEHPVPFDEFHERGMLAVDVADTAASREG